MICGEKKEKYNLITQLSGNQLKYEKKSCTHQDVHDKRVFKEKADRWSDSGRAADFSTASKEGRDCGITPPKCGETV